jgi:hypothetical protein
VITVVLMLSVRVPGHVTLDLLGRSASLQPRTVIVSTSPSN